MIAVSLRRGAALTVLALGLLAAGCRSVSLADLATPRPVPDGACVVVGFLGGRDAWDDRSKGVRRVALRLRDPEGRRFTETFENRRVDVALEFVREALDADRNGRIGPAEAALRRARLVAYGQSLGGGAAVTFARLLRARGVPVHLLIQIDSVGIGDDRLPPNVRYAANLYQDDGRLIAGEHPVRAADPDRTRVLANWEFEYDRPPGSRIDIDDLPWHKVAFRAAHARMDRDPRVWRRVERLIETACAGGDLRAESAAIDRLHESP